jgi:membrane protein involved in colicin uptake
VYSNNQAISFAPRFCFYYGLLSVLFQHVEVDEHGEGASRRQAVMVETQTSVESDHLSDSTSNPTSPGKPSKKKN